MDVTQHMHYASRPETVAQAWKKIKALILAEVGLAKLSTPYLMKQLPLLRKVSKEAYRP